MDTANPPRRSQPGLVPEASGAWGPTPTPGRRHYLDHASTSPARPVVVDAMRDWAGAADPARVHTEGRMARAAVESARDAVAALLGVRSRQVLFTGSGTEAINSAVWGTMQGRDGLVIAAGVEHSAVLAASARHQVRVLEVDAVGRVDLDHLADLLSANTVCLVHCQVANHEVGTVQPVRQVIELAQRHGALVHVDACAAAGHLALDLADLGADLVSVSAHKLGGSQGIGALIIKRGLRIDPLLVGGAQERGRRAGMENVAAIAGFGAAATQLAGGAMETEAAEARRHTTRLAEVLTAMGGIRLFGDPTERLPHIVCFGVDGVEAEGVLIGLDQAGVAAHSGSACSSEELAPSPVLDAMGADADHSLRLSVGWSTTAADVEATLGALPGVVARLRSLGARQ